MLRLTLFSLFISFGAFSQYKNSVKTNLAAGVSQIYSLQYERMLSKNFSFNSTFFYRPKSNIPFGSFVDELAKKHGVGVTGIKFDYIFMNEAKLGVKGFSPEFRSYLGKKRHQPFLGVFGMYEDFDMQVPAELDILKDGNFYTVKLPINFTFNTITGGLLIGQRFKWNRVGLDVVLIGLHLGKANDFYAFGENPSIQGLSPNEKDYLISQVKERFGIKDKYFDLKITDERAEIKSIRKVPYIGFRGLGFNLSYNF